MHAFAVVLLSLVVSLSTASAASANRLPFGFNEEYAFGTDGATPIEKLDLTHTAGGRLARVTLDWGCVEGVRNRWNRTCWSQYQDFYWAAKARGMVPIVTLHSSPKWAQAHPCRPKYALCDIPPARAYDYEWREFAAEAAARMPEAVFEVWNEANLVPYWNGEPQPKRYAELVRLARLGIKTGSPAARLLAGGVLGTVEDSRVRMPSRIFLRRAFRSGQGMRKAIDGLSFHAFGLGSSRGRNPSFHLVLREMRKTARTYLPRRRERLWVTEIGASTRHPESLSLRQQKNRLWRAWKKLNTTRKVRGVVFHRLTHPRESTDSKWHRGLAWLRYRPLARYPAPIKPKPVFCRFARRLGDGYSPCRR